MQANEAIGRAARCIGLETHVVRVDEFQLCLLGVATEGIASFECLELGDCIVVIRCTQTPLRGLVKLLLGAFRYLWRFLVIAEER